MVRHANVRVADYVRADGRVEGEAIHAVTSRVHEHCRGAINDVAGRDLTDAGLQYVYQRVATAAGVGVAPQYGKNRTDRNVDVDVRGPVQRIEDDDVPAVLAVAVDDDRFLIFFRRHYRDYAARPQAVEQGLVREVVEALDGFAVDVRLAL